MPRRLLTLSTVCAVALLALAGCGTVATPTSGTTVSASMGTSGTPPPTPSSAASPPASSAVVVPSPLAVPNAPVTATDECGRAIPAPLPAAVSSRLLAVLRAGRASIRAPGIEAAVLLPDGSAWSGAVGWAAQNVPLTTGDAMPWASAGKPAVAATLLRLLEASGRADATGGTARVPMTLSTPAAGIVPGLHTARGATLGDLLAHRAGLSEPFNDPVILRGLVDNPFALWRPTTILAATRVVARRGTFIYSNSDYIAAGILIAKLARQPWPAAVRRLVLSPAGSKAWAPAFESGCGPVGHSFSVVAGSPPRDLTGSSGIPPFPAIVSAMGAAGGFVGTALDLVRMGHEIATSRDLLPLLVVQTHSTPVEGPYGMGVSRSQVLGLSAVGHGGRLAGTRTVWRCILGGGPCVGVLANRTGIEVEPIAEALLKVVLGR